MSTERIHNFNAGPSALPLEVLEEVHDGFMNFKGMSVLEISHRSKQFVAIMDEARSLIAELMDIPSIYKILFLQGGAAQQFAMVPLNLMDRSADYVITGHWAKRALAEARVVGDARVIYSSEDQGFTRVPDKGEIKPTDGASYVHITTNNTIYGTQYKQIPDTQGVPLIADMSSDILSRHLNISQFGLIYAGAQKNMGPAGVTCVIIRDDLLAHKPRALPDVLRYSTHAEKESLYNTPPVFAIYVMMLTLRWIKKLGGVKAIEQTNAIKAAMLYEAIDASSLYKGVAEPNSRSMMNVTFTMPSEELAERFVSEAAKSNIVGIKGHRSVGGLRASIYNASPLESVQALISFMKEFERTNA
ncbi:MAG: 3-phosphoserine/phosphohydroxythreonine transaminase [Pseudomonadota bacterium]